MIYLLALLPATALTIAGYFVLYLSERTEGTLRTFGRYLGFWAFTLAGLVILGALFAAAHSGIGGPQGSWYGGPHEGGWHGGPHGEGWYRPHGGWYGAPDAMGGMGGMHCPMEEGGREGAPRSGAGTGMGPPGAAPHAAAPPQGAAKPSEAPSPPPTSAH